VFQLVLDSPELMITCALYAMVLEQGIWTKKTSAHEIIASDLKHRLEPQHLGHQTVILLVPRLLFGELAHLALDVVPRTRQA
jgi:hypothetical protein